MKITTSDLYEAAYYYIYKGEILAIKSKVIAKNRARKLGYAREFFLTMQVPTWCVELWRKGMVWVDLHEFKAARKALKKLVKKQLL